MLELMGAVGTVCYYIYDSCVNCAKMFCQPHSLIIHTQNQNRSCVSLFRVRQRSRFILATFTICAKVYLLYLQCRVSAHTALQATHTQSARLRIVLHRIPTQHQRRRTQYRGPLRDNRSYRQDCESGKYSFSHKRNFKIHIAMNHHRVLSVIFLGIGRAIADNTVCQI